MKNTAKLLSLLLVMGFLGGCAGNSSRVETMYENQQKLETEVRELKTLESEVDTLRVQLRGTEQHNAELQREIERLERMMENRSKYNKNYETREISVHESGELWGEIEGEEQTGRSDEEDFKQSRKPKFSDQQKLRNIETMDSADQLHKTAVNYFEKGNYKLSILAYQEFIDKFPRDSRVPRAYLKQGYALMKMGKRKEAAYFFSGVLSKFPESSEAQLASNELKDIR